MTKKRCSILGYEVDLLSFMDSVNFVASKINNNEGLHIITINPEIIAIADQNKELADIINQSELVLPESSGIKSALKFRGIKQEQIPGIDFARELLKYCEINKYPVALVGAKKDIIEKAIENLQKEMPSLNIVYAHDGYYEDENTILEELILKKPKVILCALGAPKQELFIDKCRNKYENAIYIGVGGSFDVWAGAVQRAPEIFQKLGLEWAYRTIKQPSRIKRIYKTLPVFLFRAIIESIKVNKK